MVDDAEHPDQRIVLVRHAQTASSLTGRHTGTDDPGWDLWADGAPDGESPDVLATRLDRVVDELLEVCEHHGDVLVFAHGHSLRALTVRWLGLPITHGRHLRLGTGSISTLGWKREVRVLETWNDRSHLAGAT